MELQNVDMITATFRTGTEEADVHEIKRQKTSVRPHISCTKTFNGSQLCFILNVFWSISISFSCVTGHGNPQ
jgi:hypothetical protein